MTDPKTIAQKALTCFLQLRELDTTGKAAVIGIMNTLLQAELQSHNQLLHQLAMQALQPPPTGPSDEYRQ